jgi:5-formyltetrahydrofolate cyclo-ligase
LKHALRTRLKKLRASLSAERRQEASERARKHILQLAHEYAYILSYHSFGTELDTHVLNQALAQLGKLVLPKTEADQLRLFHVEDVRDLIPSSLSMLEPNPSHQQECSPDSIFLALVPALGFDSSGHRLGYGKGYYDRFLACHPHIHSIGIGFQEQLVDQPLPAAPTDCPVHELLLV